MRFSKRAFLASGLAVIGLPGWAAAPDRSARPRARPDQVTAQSVKARHTRGRISEIVAEAGLSGDHSIVVMDVKTGKVIESHTPRKTLPPASVAKAATALYALYQLGSDYRFNTRLLATGPIRNGELQGNLILQGGGDPHLDTDGLFELIRQARAQGLRRVKGQFLVHDGAIPHQFQIDASQPAHVGYNPAISGLNLNFNRVYFEWKASGGGYAVTMDARTNKLRPQVSRITMDVVNRNGPLYGYKSTNKGEQWSVMQSALGKGGGRWLPVRDPGGYVGEVFRTLAADQGIRLPKPKDAGTLPGSAAQIALVRSATLPRILQAMLRYSTNLTAETVGMMASRKSASSIQKLRGSARAMNGWIEAQFGVRGMSFADHSGLSGEARISAAQMAQLLRKAGWDGPLRQILKPVKLINARGNAAPIAGVNVVAKTGTLNFASSLAGYIETPNGRHLAFAILSSDLSKRARIKKADRERPQGARGWSKRARRMQQRLIRHWALEYGV